MRGGGRYSDAKIRRGRGPVTSDGVPSPRPTKPRRPAGRRRDAVPHGGRADPYRTTRNSTGKETQTGTRMSRFMAGEKR